MAGVFECKLFRGAKRNEGSLERKDVRASLNDGVERRVTAAHERKRRARKAGSRGRESGGGKGVEDAVRCGLCVGRRGWVHLDCFFSELRDQLYEQRVVPVLAYTRYLTYKHQQWQNERAAAAAVPTTTPTAAAAGQPDKTRHGR